MIEILRFTFESFWHWLGMAILLCIVISPVWSLIDAFRLPFLALARKWLGSSGGGK